MDLEKLRGKIVVDTREKNQLVFPIPVQVRKLSVGDYSLKGGSKVVEWKSKWDWPACLYSKDRRVRLEKQLSRLAKTRQHCLIIEHPPPAPQLWAQFPGLKADLVIWEAYKMNFRLPTYLVWTRDEAVDLILKFFCDDKVEKR